MKTGVGGAGIGLPAVGDWADALGLKRRGRERVGPCPLCGGDDRFHVREGRGGQALVGCRGCIDGQPAAIRQKRFGELLRTAFPDRETLCPECGRHPLRGGYACCFDCHRRKRAQKSDRKRPVTARKLPPAGPGTPDASTATTEPLAQEMWAASRPASRTPAQRYLAERWVWPPDGLGGPDLPDPIRWLPRAAFDLRRLSGVPADAAGLVLFGFAPVPGGPVGAVATEALTVKGKRPESRFRKGYGPRIGLAFEAAAGTSGNAVLVEGPVTALAARWLHPGCRVLAVGGTAYGACAKALDVPDGASVLLLPDGDPAGERGARKARKRLEARGVRTRLVWRSSGDPADEWADRLRARVRIIAAETGLNPAASARSAWRKVLEEQQAPAPPPDSKPIDSGAAVPDPPALQHQQRRRRNRTASGLPAAYKPDGMRLSTVCTLRRVARTRQPPRRPAGAWYRRNRPGNSSPL